MTRKNSTRKVKSVSENVSRDTVFIAEIHMFMSIESGAVSDVYILLFKNRLEICSQPLPSGFLCEIVSKVFRMTT